MFSRCECCNESESLLLTCPVQKDSLLSVTLQEGSSSSEHEPVIGVVRKMSRNSCDRVTVVSSRTLEVVSVGLDGVRVHHAVKHLVSVLLLRNSVEHVHIVSTFIGFSLSDAHDIDFTTFSSEFASVFSLHSMVFREFPDLNDNFRVLLGVSTCHVDVAFLFNIDATSAAAGFIGFEPCVHGCEFVESSGRLLLPGIESVFHGPRLSTGDSKRARRYNCVCSRCTKGHGSSKLFHATSRGDSADRNYIVFIPSLSHFNLAGRSSKQGLSFVSGGVLLSVRACDLGEVRVQDKE